MSTKAFGCFYCSGKSLEYNGTCDQCGRPIDVSADLLRLTLGDYQTRAVLGRGFYGWTLRAEDEFQSFAVKVIPEHRVRDRTSVLQEPRSLVRCSPHPNIARFFRVIRPNVSLGDQQISTVCLVFEFVPNAKPLRAIFEDKDIALSRGDIVGIIAGIARGLERMHSHDLWHDDLHDDNVLIRDVPPDEGGDARFQAILIDFGSAKSIHDEHPERGARSDYVYLSKHIYNLVARFEEGALPLLVPADRSLAARLKALARALNDPNVTRRTKVPGEVASEAEDVLATCAAGQQRPSFAEMMSEEDRVSLKTPLDNSNALYLEPQDIPLLFRDELGWQQQIGRSETTIVVGPRGCGKTMLLRHLSIGSQGRPRKGEDSADAVAERLRNSDYIAFMIRGCDLRTPFIRSAYKALQNEDEARAEEFCREYINAHFAAEAAQSMIWLMEEKLIDCSHAELVPLSRTILDLLHGQTGDGFTGERQNLGRTVDLLVRRIVQLSNLRQQKAYSPTDLARDDALALLARSLKAVPALRNRSLWFLLDDYSQTLLTSFVQWSYNPVLFRPSSDLRIRISSEGDGPELEDALGRQYKESREFTRLNLGEVYFKADEDRGRSFVESILAARCIATGVGSLDTLKSRLQEHPNEQNFGEYICQRKRPGDARFYGFGLLCQLCSGDVSYIIELFRSILGSDWASADKEIPPVRQDTLVKRFAQQQLAALRRTSEYGPKLHLFATQVGSLLKEYLLRSSQQKKERKDERLRIEIEGSGELSPQARALHNELLRHSVLIDGGYGKSMEGKPTRRLFMRRLFAPCFPFSPNRRGCVPLTVRQYERWLLDPNSIKLGNCGQDDWSSGLGSLAE